MYFKKLKDWTEMSRNMSDEALLRGFEAIDKGDLLSQFKRVVEGATKKFAFDVNYSSGRVMERNSLLNLAVIQKRTKIVKWLLLDKSANLESADRGGFTPLLNCAWSGDLQLTRFVLARGAKREAVGVTHSSRGFVAGFKGHNAEGWARKRGFAELADEIKFGLR